MSACHDFKTPLGGPNHSAVPYLPCAYCRQATLFVFVLDEVTAAKATGALERRVWGLCAFCRSSAVVPVPASAPPPRPPRL